MRRTSSAGLLFAFFLLACSSGGGNSTPPRDGAGGGDNDMGMSWEDDGGSKEDLAGRDLAGLDLSRPPNGDMSGGSDLPCLTGTYRCGPGNSVQICNSTGTAWLTSATCAVSCVGGLCTGACTPNARRCNMTNVEQCNTAGTTWNKVETCSGSCSSGTCALASLDITMNRTLDGDIYVDGDVTVRSGVSVTSPTGSLTIHAKNITVENAASITAAATGNPYGYGNASSGPYSYSGGGGGGNGTTGSPGGDGGSYGAAIGSNTDYYVYGGGSGGSGTGAGAGYGGSGGGVIRLIATDSINVVGFLTANGTNGTNYTSGNTGGGGGGAGGGVLLAASGDITMSGTISTQPGSGGSGYYSSDGRGGTGGQGRIRILAGGVMTVTGGLMGARTDGMYPLLPPPVITSSSHPDPSLIYNDDFDQVLLTWVSPFASRQSYYQMINTTTFQVPTPGTATVVKTESITYPATSVVSGSNFFHITPVDAMSHVGTVENAFRIQINNRPPGLSSSSHPSSSTWYPNYDIYFQWTWPVAKSNMKGIYYVLDRYGDTVPTKSDTMVPAVQEQVLSSVTMPGIWMMHVVTIDQRDYLTKAAAHLRVQVGDDPGTGVVLGLITDGMGKGLAGATVTVNRGLYTQITNSTGNFNFPAIPSGTYELKVSVAGKTPATQMITVTKGMSTNANVSIP